MKKKIQCIAACVLIACISISCKKQELFDKIEKSALGRIDKITGVIEQVDEGYSFEYNSYGDPVKMTSIGNASPSTGADYYFLYDEKRNLTDFYGMYVDIGTTYYHIYHRYHSDEQNRIIVDSSFTFGMIENGLPVTVQSLVVSYFEYDVLNRISRVYTKDSVGKKHTTATYKYDTNGNRTDVSKQYDDKVNIHRSNKVWQFIDRDYSQNNPLVVQSYSAYNYAGLPEQLHPSRSASYHFLEFEYYLLNVTYTSQ